MLRKAIAEMSPISQWEAPKASANAARNGPAKKAFIAVVQTPSKTIVRVFFDEVPISKLASPTQEYRRLRFWVALARHG